MRSPSSIRTSIASPPRRLRRPSDSFDNRRDPLAAADAEGDQGGVEVPPLELVEGGAEEDRAGRTQRMAKGDRAAVDVHPPGIDAEAADRLQRHHREGLVDLPEV